MSYLAEGTPLPEPNMDDAGFWENCARRRLTFQACGNCGTLRHPPTPVCHHCRSTGVVWREALSRGRVYSYTVVHHAAHDAVRPSVPYVVAVIAFPDFGPVRLISNIIGDPKAMRVDMPVELVWDKVSETMFLPRFKPV